MVNIEQITSTLAKLPDQALQRYAQMHKDDPYIMSLAISESKRRKEMRAAGQGQAQPQPKVVDQAVAAMAPQQMPSMPEEQGIGALPAAAQMNFADGGITGYAPGGVTRADVDKAYQEWMSAQPSWFQQSSPMTAQRLTDAEARYNDLLRQYQSTQGQVTPPVGTAPTPMATKGAPTYKPEDTSGMDRRLATPGATLPMAANAIKERVGEVGAIDAGLRNAGGAPAPARVSTPSAQSVEDRFLASQKKMTEQPNPYATQESAIQTEAEKLAKDKLASVEARQAMFKDAFGGREARLEERAKELEKSKDTNTGLAFLEAGLAIMSTPGGLATAIGKGAREGTAKYASGIEKLRSAKEKLDEAKDRMEELKLNRDEMSAKEKAEAELGIQQTVLSGKKDALSSAKALFGERSALSQKIVEATIGMEEKAKDRATQLQTAGAAAAVALGPQNKFIEDWLAKPENKGKTYSDAYTALKMVGSASERNDIAGLKVVREGLAKDLENLGLDKAAKQAKQAEIARIDKQILALSGIGAPSTQGGAQRTIDWNSIK